MSSGSQSQRPDAPEARYEILRSVGQGGAGTVYLARDRETGAQLALKKLLRVDPHSVLRLKREFRLLADMHHPNLVALYDLVAGADGWFITMEFLDGMDLMTHVDRHVRSARSVDAGRTLSRVSLASDSLSPAQIEGVLTLFTQLARGVQALHSAGVLHRDLKPSNVMVAAERVVVLDFGLVREQGETDPLLSHVGHVAGTPAYMAPEQAAAKPHDEPADWYAFGVMLFQALTGELPIEGHSSLELLLRKTTDDPMPIERFVPRLPRALTELCNGLLSRDPELRPNGVQVLDALERLAGAANDNARFAFDVTTTQTLGRSIGAPGALVGRRAELAQLRAAFEATRDGAAFVAHVRGVSGAGKSALVEHFLTSLERESWAGTGPARPLVLRSRCNERESMPFKALDGVLDGLVRYLHGVDELDRSYVLPLDVGDLAKLFPALHELAAVRRLVAQKPGQGDPVQTRMRGETALRELFTRLSGRRPLVVWIDDLQWGDLDSAKILKGWPEQLSNSPLLLVFSYRSDEVSTSPCLRELLAPGPEARPVAERMIELSPLAQDEVQQLCEGRLGAVAVERPELVARIAAESRGNPFLASQLATLVQAKIAHGDSGLEALSIEQLVGQSAGLLTPEAERLLHVLAIAGRPIMPRLALQAAGVQSDGQPLVHALRSLRLIRVRNTGRSQLLETYHDRVREGVVVSLPAPELVRIHSALFEVVERSEEPDADWLASLALGASRRADALRHGLVAAERAEQLLAFVRAAELWRLCIELSEPSASNGLALRRSLARCLMRAGHGAASAEVYLEAANFAEGAEAIECRWLAASQLLRCGEYARGDRIARQVLAARGERLPETDAGFLAGIVWSRGLIAMRGFDFVPAEEPVPPDTVAGLNQLALLAVEYQPYDPMRAAYLQGRALRAAFAARHPVSICRALCATAVVTSVNGSPKASRDTADLLARARRLVEDLNSDMLRASWLAARVVSEYMLARPREALEPAYEAEHLFRVTAGGEISGDYYQRFVVMAVRIGALLSIGEYARAIEELTLTRQEALATSNTNAILQLSLVQAIVDGIRDDYASSRRRLEAERRLLPSECFGLLHTLHMTAVMRTACGLHDFAWAEAYVEQDWKAWKRSLMRMSAFTSLLAVGAHLRFLVNRHVIERRRDDLERLVSADLKIAAGLPFDESRIGLVSRTRARLDWLAGRRKEAVEQLNRPAAMLDAAGAVIEVARERYAIGIMMGGSAGAALAAESERRMRDAGVVNPLGELLATYPELAGVQGCV